MDLFPANRNIERSAQAIMELSDSTRQAKYILNIWQKKVRHRGRPVVEAVDRLYEQVFDLDAFVIRKWDSSREYLVNGGPPSLSNSSLRLIERCCAELKSIHHELDKSPWSYSGMLSRFGIGSPSGRELDCWTNTIQEYAQLLMEANPTIDEDPVVQQFRQAEKAYRVYESTQDISALEKASLKMRTAVSCAPEDHRDLGDMLNTLAVWTLKQAEATEPLDSEKLLEAIRFAIRAVKATPMGDSLWFTCRNNLQDFLAVWTDLNYFQSKRLRTKTGPCRKYVSSLYEQIPFNSIRLLSPMSGDHLNFTLEQHSFDTAPRYIALSYTWIVDDYFMDSSETQHNITVNGYTFNVHENLFDALGHILADVQEAGCLLWVDSICINQSDLAERARQVSLMGKIFEGSKEVFAWLGLPLFLQETRLALSLMRSAKTKTEEYRKACGGHFSVVEGRSLNRRIVDGFPQKSQPGTVAAWQGLAHLFTRALWDRTWVVQELTTQRPTICYCGDFTFTLTDASAMIDRTIAYQELPDFDPSLWSALGSLSSINSLLNMRIRRQRVKEGQNLPLLAVMRHLRPYQCTDPRDKVYAALGLATDVAKGEIIEDYEIDVAVLYTQVACWALQKGYGLALLGLATVRPAISNIMWPSLGQPSWVPDWRIDNDLPLGPLRGNWLPTNKGSNLYDPSDEQAGDFHVLDKQLRVTGLIFDSIQFITRRQDSDPRGKDAESIRKLFLNQWKPALRAEMAQFSDVAFDRTVVADSRSEIVENEWVDIRGGRLDWDLLDKQFDQTDQVKAEQRSALLDSVQLLCLNREIGITARGHLSLLPECARIGDSIAAFFGGPCLYVVRQNSKSCQYRFIGECYVDEMMDGQALLLAKETGLVAQEIRLV